MQFGEQITLAPLTTFGIGGPARFFAEASTEDDIVEAVRFARDRGLRLFVLGGGSNLLVSDEGFDGLVLRIALRGVLEWAADDTLLLDAAAGEDWDALVTRSVNRGYQGIECLAGIPGTVGGSPIQNIGAYGQEVAQTITAVRCYAREQESFVDFANVDCGFAYRASRFNTVDRGRFIVTRVTFRLSIAQVPSLGYADLKRYFESWPTTPTVEDVAAAVRSIRNEKGMLPVAGEPDCRSAGSFFKNPVVEQARYDAIAASASGLVPRYAAAPGMVKLAAAWLVEQAGFHKGYARGQAGISSRHTLALINRGAATAQEILALRDEIVEAVEAKFGVHLEPEPVWLS